MSPCVCGDPIPSIAASNRDRMSWFSCPSDGDSDTLLWIILPGYIFLDHGGRRKRWPHTEQRHQTLFGIEEPTREQLLATYIGICAAIVLLAVLTVLVVT